MIGIQRRQCGDSWGIENSCQIEHFQFELDNPLGNTTIGCHLEISTLIELDPSERLRWEQFQWVG